MSHVPNELPEEFPNDVPLMHDLKMNDAHFRNLSERYHELNRQVHRSEMNIEPVSDDTLEDMKKERLLLKDTIAAYLKKAAT
jgi:uncharacterized protein YdcH (DUF465 family)